MVTIEIEESRGVVRWVAYGALALIGSLALACLASIWIAVLALDRARLAEDRNAECRAAEVQLIEAQARMETVRELLGFVRERKEIKKAIGGP